MLGQPRVHLRRCESTNAHARGLAGAGAPHGTLVTASEQTAGRGRQGRRWLAPAGTSVLMSLVLRDPPALLSLAAGVAVAATATAWAAPAEAPAAVTLKWPNDVWLGGAKVAGILVEARPQEGWAVLGIGLNVAIAPAAFPPGITGAATSLGLGAGDVEAVLARLLAELEHWTVAPAAEVLAAFRARDALSGRPVRWADGAGRAAGIDAAGALIVATPDGAKVHLDAGEVHLELT
jgi:BirA family biotin operon repressor/biotin-[acetyl-CoA-carboxylase] ligase